MYLKKLNLKNFRNYDNLDIKLNKNINIIYGNNAQGKTNLLESIYVLSMARSHQFSIDNNLIKYGKEKCKVKGIVEDNKINTTLEISFSDKNKNLKIDNNEIKKVGNYITSMFSTIIFYPEDLEIIKGSPQERRNFINLELSQISNNYYKILTEYNKLLKIRNNLFKKSKIDEAYFNIITKSLIEKAVIIYKMRYKFINEINQECGKIFYSFTKNENFKLNYEPNIEFDNFETEYLKNKLIDKFKKNYEKEINALTTLYGPHRDEVIFLLDNKNIKEFGSQGQQRVAILSVKLSEINIFKKYKKVNPILLLDDVFSELDDIKKNNLIKYLKNDNQVVITTTDLKRINKKTLGQASVFKIKEGKIIRMEEFE